MRDLFSSLKKGGYLFIEVPNCNEEYYNTRSGDSPHVCFFNSKSLRLISEKVGFAVVNIGTFGFSWSEDIQWRSGKISRDLDDYQNTPNPVGFNLRMLCVKSTEFKRGLWVM